jgi:hypothetical protein
MAMNTTAPYQKSLAYWLAVICKSLSSNISERKFAACVSFEKSTPVSFRGPGDVSELLLEFIVERYLVLR